MMSGGGYSAIDDPKASGSVPAAPGPDPQTIKFADSNLQTFPPSEAKGKISGAYRPPTDADDTFSSKAGGGGGTVGGAAGSDDAGQGGWFRMFSVAAYKPYFDVDTSDVVERIWESVFPFRGTFTEKTSENPDLYGPFWTCTTLIFVAASIATFVTYLSHKWHKKEWNYDINLVTWSAGLFYGYVTFVPLGLYVILNLTPVCLAEAFSRLDLEDMWRGAMACCRSWRDAARSRSALFAALNLDPAFESVGADAAEWWTPAFQRRVDAMLRSAASLAAGELREVRVRHCSDDALAFAAERSPKLSILSIRSSPSVSDRSMLTVASCCPMLTELDISCCCEVSYKSLEVIGQNCPNLMVLKRNIFNWLDPSEHAGIVPDDYLRECPQDGDREAIAISKFMQKLKHLVLRFSKLSVVGLNSISGGCKELEVLDLFGCANLTSRGIEQAAANLKNLETLVRPNFYIPRSSFHIGRYGHWQLYDERFQTNVFQI